jgi:hypothetical protein
VLFDVRPQQGKQIAARPKMVLQYGFGPVILEERPA